MKICAPSSSIRLIEILIPIASLGTVIVVGDREARDTPSAELRIRNRILQALEVSMPEPGASWG